MLHHLNNNFSAIHAIRIGKFECIPKSFQKFVINETKQIRRPILIEFDPETESTFCMTKFRSRVCYNTCYANLLQQFSTSNSLSFFPDNFGEGTTTTSATITSHIHRASEEPKPLCCCNSSDEFLQHHDIPDDPFTHRYVHSFHEGVSAQLQDFIARALLQMASVSFDPRNDVPISVEVDPVINAAICESKFTTIPTIVFPHETSMFSETKN